VIVYVPIGLAAVLLVVQVSIFRLLKRILGATVNNNQLEWRRIEVLLGNAAATGLRIEEGAEGDRSAVAAVADNLATAQAVVEQVATDLADQHQRADDAEGPPGEAADAASRSA